MVDPFVSEPLGGWIRRRFGERREAAVVSGFSGDIAVAAVSLSGCPEPGREVVLNTSMNRGGQERFARPRRPADVRRNQLEPTGLHRFPSRSKLEQSSSAEYKGFRAISVRLVGHFFRIGGPVRAVRPVASLRFAETRFRPGFRPIDAARYPAAVFGHFRIVL